MAGRNSFIFHYDFAEILAELSGDDAKTLINALVDYDSMGTIPSLTGAVKIAFVAIKMQIDKDRAKWEETCEKNSDNGKLGGRPRKTETNPEKRTVFQETQKSERFLEKPKKADYDCDYDYDNDYEDQKTKNSCSLPEKPATERKPSRLDIAFDDFWASYPRKVGKGAAKKSWDKIRPSPELHGKILAAVAAAKKSKQWAEDIKYIPHPSTWLNQERWEDEILSDGIPPEDAERQRTLEAWLKEDSNG